MNRIPKHELVFLILSLLFVFALFLRTSIAVIAEDLIILFAISATSLGIMSSAFFWTYGMLQIPIGVLVDRIGIRTTVIGFGFIGVLGTFLFSFSPNIQIATWGRILMGAGTAGVWIPTLKYLSVTYPAGEFATRASIISAIGGLGMIFSTLPLALLVESIGWRFSFNIMAVLFLVMVGIAWCLLDKPKAKESDSSFDSSIYFSFWKVKSFWLFTLWAFLTYGIAFSFQSLWGAAYLQNIFGLSREAAGSHLMFASIGLIIGAPSWGVLSDRFIRARRPVLFFSTLGLLATWISLYFISSYPGFFLTSLLYFGIGFFCSSFIVNFSCVKELLPLNIAGTAMGTVNTVMFLGIGFFQGVTGYIIDLYVDSGIAAYRSVFSFFIVSIFAALVIVYFIPETFSQKEKLSKANSRGVVGNEYRKI